MKRDSNVSGIDIAKRVSRVIGPALAQVNVSAKEAVSMSSHGAMRRNQGETPPIASVRGVTRRVCYALLPFCEMLWLCVTHS